MKTLTNYYEDLVLDPKANCFCMLKPGFVKYKDEFEKLLRVHGWKICKTCTKLFTRPEIEEFYICHKDKGFYNKLCDYMITEACQCYAVYKHIKNPVKDMESFKEKIRQEWGEDEMRNGMHSSDSDDNVKREIELAFNCVNERLVLSKNKENKQITLDILKDLFKEYGKLKHNVEPIINLKSFYKKMKLTIPNELGNRFILSCIQFTKGDIKLIFKSDWGSTKNTAVTDINDLKQVLGNGDIYAGELILNEILNKLESCVNINERLVLSKNKRHINPKDFFDVLEKYTGEYKLGRLKGTFSLKKYCKINDIDPSFVCIGENEEYVFSADTILVENIDGRRIVVLGYDQVGDSVNRAFDDFDDFVEEVLNRFGEHHDDPITGEEHFQNIYNILIDNK